MTITNLEEYFTNEYISTDEDPHVISLVKTSKNVLDVGCGDNLFKKYHQNGNFIGIDLFNTNADWTFDVYDFVSPFKYDLIICFGSINFYNIQWIDDRMHKVASLLAPNGRICMKVNPCKPFANGVKLEWFNKWTLPLAEHYAEMFNFNIENIREGEEGRFKFDYVAR